MPETIRGLSSLIWGYNGTNFIGATLEIKELYQFLQQPSSQRDISNDKKITLKFIPQHAPHFGGLWEAAVKSTKTHLRRILRDVKLTYEEFSTLLTQIKACLNSRPLVPLPNDDDGIEALTPGHFLIGKPLSPFPETTPTGSISLLKRWQLCLDTSGNVGPMSTLHNLVGSTNGDTPQEIFNLVLGRNLQYPLNGH